MSPEEQTTAEGNRDRGDAAGNHLFPVFLKMERLHLLIIGGGAVALEKLNAILQNAPATQITLVAVSIKPEIRTLAALHPALQLIERAYETGDLADASLVIAAVNDKSVSQQVREDAHDAGLLINVADTPDQCDFYLSSIVQKGNLKIAISTNGKSPTIAKRVKEVINELIPFEMESVLDNMQTLRNRMDGDFTQKVRQLNELTNVLVAKRAVLSDKGDQKKWPQIVKWCLLAFFFMVLGHALLSLVPFPAITEGIRSVAYKVDKKIFLLMLITGFAAQMVDGSLGMGYGTISTTILLAIGINPAIVSSRVHSARVFSSGVSGWSHHRFGNINKKLFRALVIPGCIGAILGAILAFYGQKYAAEVRIPLSLYTLYLGYYIIRKAFKRKIAAGKVTGAGWLASVGGFLDAFAGGGWGTLVTSTLISKRRNARYVIGSVCLAEFFVVFASSITFFIVLKNIPLLDVAGLIIGGLIAAPIAARLVGKLHLKTMFILIGSLVILTSISTLYKSLMSAFGH